jgi:hypothetical protein
MSLGVIESLESVCEERAGVCAGERETAHRLLNPRSKSTATARATRAQTIVLVRGLSDVSWRDLCVRDKLCADVPASHSRAYPKALEPRNEYSCLRGRSSRMVLRLKADYHKNFSHAKRTNEYRSGCF